MSAIAPNVTLDALFRRNATLRGDHCALRDTGGAQLTYAEVASAVAHVAETIASLGLPPRSSVALLLPNGRELIVALLAAMRCGHLPVPMPVAWRKSDLVRACREAETGALLTTAHFGGERLPELAAEVATEVFELSFPCAFGAQLPDGLIPLPFNTTSQPLLAKAALGDAPAAGIATLQPSSGGVSFVPHADDEMLAAGLSAMLAGDIRGGDTIVSAVSFASFAGLTTAFVPWLLSSGTLTLLSDLPERDALAYDKNTHLVASAGLLPELVGASSPALSSVYAVHFGKSGSFTVFPALNAKAAVDVIAIEEAAAIALPRRERGTVAALAAGHIHAGNGGEAAPVVVETRVDGERVHVRGPMVPKALLRDREWLETSFTARKAGAAAFHALPPQELVAIGALRFDLPDLERRIRAAALVADIRVEADTNLGERLVIECDRPAEVSKALLDAGLPRIVAVSVQKAETMRARTG